MNCGHEWAADVAGGRGPSWQHLAEASCFQPHPPCCEECSSADLLHSLSSSLHPDPPRQLTSSSSPLTGTNDPPAHRSSTLSRQKNPLGPSKTWSTVEEPVFAKPVSRISQNGNLASPRERICCLARDCRKGSGPSKDRDRWTARGPFAFSGFCDPKKFTPVLAKKVKVAGWTESQAWLSTLPFNDFWSTPEFSPVFAVRHTTIASSLVRRLPKLLSSPAVSIPVRKDLFRRVSPLRDPSKKTLCSLFGGKRCNWGGLGRQGKVGRRSPLGA
jgi:hypothetical protein